MNRLGRLIAKIRHRRRRPALIFEHDDEEMSLAVYIPPEAPEEIRRQALESGLDFREEPPRR